MDAIVIGAGVAGPATALALGQAGASATVFEAHGRPDRDVGSYLTVTANGLEALRAIGVLEPVMDVGFPTRHNVLWNESGRRLATLSLGSHSDGRPAALTMKRSALSRVLADEAERRGIAVVYGRPLRAASVGPDGRVATTFDDGGSASGDVLVGADGIHSLVRRIIDPRAPDGRYVGLVNFGGVTRGATTGLDTEPEAWHLIFGRRAFFGYQAMPRGDVVWFANVPGPTTSPAERAAMTEAMWRTRLAGLFAGDAGPAAELIRAGELELAGDDTYALGHVPTWCRGPMVVIGDAAHAPAPTSGQGASMAVEDAVVLAASLRSAPSVGEGLAAFERARRERVERIVSWGARGSRSKIPGRSGRVIRDVALRLLFRYVVTQRSLAWMYDYRVCAAG